MLILNGWVDWADGSTFMAASQAKKDLVLPYLQVKDAAGQWQTVIEDMGIPAGKPKTIAVDLTGKFLSASREVRIVTNLCVYWDEIFLSEETGRAARAPDRYPGRIGRPAFPRLLHAGDSSAAQAARGLRLRAVDAGLDVESHPGTLYALRRRAAADRRDRRPAGDHGLGRRIAAAVSRARRRRRCRAGWKRDFLLFVDGWAKDADANTAYSQTVEPLPFHAMSQYPYHDGEHFPDDAAHRQYREQYNTRPALLLIRPLIDSNLRAMIADRP